MLETIDNETGPDSDGFCPVKRPISKGEGSAGWNEGEPVHGATDKFLETYRNKERILMEANTEKERRLEELEKEYNDHNVQHKEGIYWLRLQLKTTRKEKDAAEKRIVELQKEMRMFTVDHDDSKRTKDDSTINSYCDEKDILIAQMRTRLENYETSFGVMENQMSIIESSTGVVIKTLREEIAKLMEDRTKAELDLLNQLSELDKQTQRRQLEHALEIQNKNETIETLRKGHQASFSTATMTVSGSSRGNQSDTTGCGVSSNCHAESQVDEILIQQLGEEKAELERKLEVAARELEDLRSVSNANDKTKCVTQIWEERHEIYLSIRRMKEVLESTSTSVSSLNDLVMGLHPNDDSHIKKEKEIMLSMLESASLVTGQVKLSIALIEQKLRNKFDRIKMDILMNGGDQETLSRNKEVIRDIEQVRNGALAELGTVGAKFLDLLKDLEERAQFEKRELEDMLQEKTGKISEFEKKMKELQDQRSAHDGMGSSSSELGHDSESSKQLTEDTVMISRDVLYLLEVELVQFAERMHLKNEKIHLLKAELDRQRVREDSLKKELDAASKGTSGGNGSGTHTKEFFMLNDEDVDDSPKPMKDIIVKAKPTELGVFSPLPTRSPIPPEPSSLDHLIPKVTLKNETIKRRSGMPDESLRGGTDPVSPSKLTLPRHALGLLSPSPNTKQGIVISPELIPFSEVKRQEPITRMYIPSSLFPGGL